jgi:hypothetical protein
MSRRLTVARWFFRNRYFINFTAHCIPFYCLLRAGAMISGPAGFWLAVAGSGIFLCGFGTLILKEWLPVYIEALSKHNP